MGGEERDGLRPARRFLHVAYCCADADAVTAFFVDHLAMRNTMSTPAEWSDGALLGLDGPIFGAAAFVYDQRGPRSSPAIEVQSWVTPPLVGTPPTDPTEVGIQAIGFAVADVAAAVERLVDVGCRVVGAAGQVTLRDPTGVTLDLVADSTVPAGETRMHHLRITVSDLDASLAWYEALGFAVAARTELADGSAIGASPEARADVVHLRLPDEPYEAVLVHWRDGLGHGRHTPHPNHAGLFRTAVGVDDTRASYAALRAAGVGFARAPSLVELHGTPVPDMWICFLDDPDGVPFEFVERPRSAFR